MTDQPYHTPALLSPSIEALDIKPSGIYVDCTLGGGGHTAAILHTLEQAQSRQSDAPQGRLISLDQDSEAIARAEDDPRLTGAPAGMFTPVHGNFRYLTNYLRYLGIQKVDGILADLGVSFHHFDTPGRGFSFRWEGPLDMRMNQDAPLTAADFLQSATQQQLTDTLRLYGELRQGPRMAAAIVKAREKAPLLTAPQLIETVEPMLNPRCRKKELAQLFQALRIEVNNEISALESLLTQSVKLLAPGGRIAIITYHSLEDRLVKNFFRTGNLQGHENKDIYGRNLSPLRLLNSKPIVPDQAEIEANPRSRSAKLRIAQLIDQ